LDADSTDEGILAKILVPDGSTAVPVNKLIAVLVKNGEDWKNVEIPAEVPAAAAPVSDTAKAASSASPSVSAASAPSTAAHDSHDYVGFPSVRRLLNAYNVDPKNVPATGPSGRLVKGDVLTFVEKNKLQPALQKVASTASAPSSAAAVPKTKAPSAAPTSSATIAAVSSSTEYVDTPASTMRQVIAKRLTESKTTVPHLYLSHEMKLGKVMSLRKQYKANGSNISVNDVVIKAVAKALRMVPEVNVYFNPKTGKADPQKTVDVSVAVAIENGLITPIIKNTDQKTFSQINKEMKELADKAKKGALLPQEYQGGTFTVSNLGMFGIPNFQAVINPPQAAIMAIGGGVEKLTVNAAGKPVMETFLKVSLSCDARAVTPFSAAKFLQSFAQVMEEPSLVML